MKDNQVIDYVFKEMCRVSDTKKINFSSFAGSWGFRGSDAYMMRVSNFIDYLKEVAKGVEVRYWKKGYYVFDGKIWVSVPKDVIEAGYDEFIRYHKITAMIWNKTAFNKEFLEIVRMHNPLEPSFSIVAFNNGVLNLEDMSFHHFSSNYHVTYYHPYRYNSKERCPLWQAFLKEVLPDPTSRLVLQMFLGLGLIERGTAYNSFEGKDFSKVELCLMLIGSGANGKSVIYQTAVGLFGKDRISGVDYDDLTSIGDEGMRSRRLLRDCIFNWSSDSDPRTFGRKHSNMFKKIVSGESVTDRAIGENVMENDMLPYLVFNLNELPFPEDVSLGFIRRLQIIPFYKTITPDRQDKALAFKLTQEYSGIFNWVVRGMKELRRRRFVFPDAMGAENMLIITQLKKHPTDAFVRTYGLRPEPQAPGEQGVYILAKDIKDAVYSFCEENDASEPTDKALGDAMRRAGFSKKRASKGYAYLVYGCPASRLKVRMVINMKPENADSALLDDPNSFIDIDD